MMIGSQRRRLHPLILRRRRRNQTAKSNDDRNVSDLEDKLLVAEKRDMPRIDLATLVVSIKIQLCYLLIRTSNVPFQKANAC